LWTGVVKSRGLSSEGLLLIDHEGRRLLFEGDFERYIIPADAILAASIETLPNTPATLAAPYIVVLHVRTPQRTQEMPFYPQFNLAGENNWERAEELLGQFEGICQRQFERRSSPPPQSIQAV
jgi:hypothetical protein